jgi:RimJ/RimL family protein N-acetyltransferase
MTPRPAYRIETPRLLIRCYDPADAPLLLTAITESLEHLREWMPWARDEPTTVERKAELLRSFRAQFDTDKDYIYGIFTPDGTRLVGGTGLHTRQGEGALEIGYWIVPDLQGRGLITEATGALVRVGIEAMGARWIEIRCDPRNTRSHAVAARLGFTHDATLRGRALIPDGGPRDTMVWSLFAGEYPASPAAGIEVRAFDVLRRRIF